MSGPPTPEQPVCAGRPASGTAQHSADSVELPASTTGPGAALAWGSDAFAEVLARLDLPYIALNPGASYRGLHDSLVNYGGNRGPQMILCLHEEHAVALAHGYAKVTGQPARRRAAQQCRADARDDGALQRLLRPRADAHARRHRARRRRAATALDRLDSHLSRPGRSRPQLPQVG